MPYSALLFDLDDTILDFAASEEAALTHLHATFFSAHHSEHHVKETFREINTGLWDLVSLGQIRPVDVKSERFRALLEALQLDMDIETMARSYENVLGEQVFWFEGVEHSLNLLRERFEIGIVTNGLTDVQKMKYVLSGISTWCPCFIISEEVGLAKPDPKIFDLALSQLAKEPHEVLMIGDSLLSDFQGALQSNLDFCWINPMEKPLPEGYPEPKYTIKSVAQLPSII